MLLSQFDSATCFSLRRPSTVSRRADMELTAINS
nr:MAG TPA: hypothetical protein [Caudoviricetes sp.]